MKPFLLLQSRPEDEASDNEYEGFLRATGLQSNELTRMRVEAAPLPEIRLEDYSAIIVGGGPFSTSDPEDSKSIIQRRLEADFRRLLDEVVVKDFPFFGACYGIGTLGAHQGALISRKYGENVAPVTITLSQAGSEDPLLADMPRSFQAIAGHKEACEILPPNAVLLASSSACPVQMFRIKNNLYATQFHPELDLHGLAVRVGIYKHAGYFPPEDADKIIAQAETADLSQVERILQNFVERYRREA